MTLFVLRFPSRPMCREELPYPDMGPGWLDVIHEINGYLDDDEIQERGFGSPELIYPYGGEDRTCEKYPHFRVLLPLRGNDDGVRLCADTEDAIALLKRAGRALKYPRPAHADQWWEGIA